MKKLASRLMTVLLSLSLIPGTIGCDKEADQMLNEGELKVINTNCDPVEFTLWAGAAQNDTTKGTNVGTLTVWNDATNVYVKYQMHEGTFSEVQMWIGSDPLLVPATQGQFPNKAENDSSVTFTLALADIITETSDYCDVPLYIYAHGTIDGETFWSYGTPWDPAWSNKWGWFSVYTVCCQEIPPVCEYYSETAFAKFSIADGGYVFVTTPKNTKLGDKNNPEKYPYLNLTQNRWGWAINLQTEGTTITADVYAGAGLNNIANGVKVGTVAITWNGDMLDLNYTLLPGFGISELHVYASHTILNTIAPGQFGVPEYFDPAVTGTINRSYLITPGTMPSDGIWVCVHAVAQIPL
ncbi:MAG: hypothetical protein JXR39_13620 [Marinilabiliaceae bacterium]|nr:hypothetical protein [Marinilabiliaceae bacterium]